MSINLLDGRLLSLETPCPYFADGRTAKIEYFHHTRQAILDFDRYLALGYRRLGNTLYRNSCPGCTQCYSLRIDVGKFTVSRSQRRTINSCREVVCTVSQPKVTDEKIALFTNYQLVKHDESPDPGAEHESIDSLEALHYGSPLALEMDYSLGGKLFAVGVIDCGGESISSNYFYYDTDYLRLRPGVFGMLSEINLARMSGKRYFYPGFYIEENRKMAYKKFFRPNEVLLDGVWTPFIGAADRDGAE